MDEAHHSTASADPPSPRPQRKSRIGEVIGDRYEVLRVIGEGGMGVVYEVRHRAIGRHFAMKFLHVDMASRRSIVGRFRREAEAAAGLQSENVVAIVDFATCEDGSPYLVMEYLEGEDLAKALKRTGPMPVGRALEIVAQVCRGLRVAHRRGVVHRDLKPENLFLHTDPDRDEIVKILDFGIAKLVSEVQAETKTQSGLTLGTPFYMSPEQARGDTTIDERTDVYALGVILYELLTGEKPHPGSNATAVLFHLLKQEPVRVESLRSGLPAGLGDVVHRAFAFDVEERFRSVADLETALAPYRDEGGSAGSLMPATATRGELLHASAWRSRSTWLAVAVSAPVWLVLGSLARGAFPSREHPGRPVSDAPLPEAESPPAAATEPTSFASPSRAAEAEAPEGPASPAKPSRPQSRGAPPARARPEPVPSASPSSRASHDYLYEP
jgi:serine/threonine-protein kinase